MAITVALVNDQSELRPGLAEILNHARGYRCISAYGSADEALRHLPQDRPDVVVMDLELAGRSGLQCVERLKAIAPTMHILILTASEDSEIIFQALSAGASGYLLKRTPLAQLLEAISEVHAGGAPMSRIIARKVVQYFQTHPGSPEGREGLSPRETEVVEALSHGNTYKQIAHCLHISVPTVRTYIQRTYEKLHVHSRTEAVAKYLRSEAPRRVSCALPRVEHSPMTGRGKPAIA